MLAGEDLAGFRIASVGQCAQDAEGDVSVHLRVHSVPTGGFGTSVKSITRSGLMPIAVRSESTGVGIMNYDDLSDLLVLGEPILADERIRQRSFPFGSGALPAPARLSSQHLRRPQNGHKNPSPDVLPIAATTRHSGCDTNGHLRRKPPVQDRGAVVLVPEGTSAFSLPGVGYVRTARSGRDRIPVRLEPAASVPPG